MKNRNLLSALLYCVTVLFGLAGFALCIFVLPWFPKIITDVYPMLSFLRCFVTVGVYAAAIVYFIALYRFMGFIKLCANNDAYSSKSLSTLSCICKCSVIFGILYLFSAMPVVFVVADSEDAPGLILIGLSLDAIPLGIAAFSSLLKGLIAEVTDRCNKKEQIF